MRSTRSRSSTRWCRAARAVHHSALSEATSSTSSRASTLADQAREQTQNGESDDVPSTHAASGTLMRSKLSARSM